MIVLPAEQIVIMTPPHTASRNLHHAFCENGTGVPGAIWMVSPCPDGITTDHHGVRMIPDWEGWKKAIVVRNPFDRLIGLWWHLVDWTRYNGHGCSDFAEFVRWVHADDSGRLSWMYRYTLDRWLGDLKPDVLLRYENLEADVASLVGREVPIRKWGSGRPRRPVAFHYEDEETRELAIRWSLPDCQRFNYGTAP